MADISFYHLHASPLEKALPRLMEKVHQSGAHAQIVAVDDEQVEWLNKQLWTYTTKYFLPHGSYKDKYKEDQPIYLTNSIEDNANGSTILALVSGQELDFSDNALKGYTRILDMFDGTLDHMLQSARHRWKTYKEQDHDLTYWKQTAKGGWEKGA